MSMPVRATLFSLAAVAALAAPTPTASQEVHGTATSGRDGAPLPGALMELVDPSGRTVHTALSAADGSFRLKARSPGQHTVRGEAVGHGAWGAEVDLGAEPTTLAAPFPAGSLDLEIPRIKADPGRRQPEGASARITALWAEAAKVFRIVEWTRTSGSVQVQTETWYRSMEPRRLRVMEEEHTPRPGFHASGRLPSPPARELAEQGFIWGGGPGEGLSFHGPDAATLMDPVFAETHALGFEPKGPEDGWVGLTFAPLDDDARDVEGTLWIDGATGAPRRLEYRYTTLPWPIKTDKVGGGMDLERLAGGAWIVRRWWLRMPRVGVTEQRITQWDPPRRRFSLTGVVEEGGMVTRVRLADGQIENLSPPQP